MYRLINIKKALTTVLFLDAKVAVIAELTFAVGA